MLDMGFIHDVRKIVSQCRRERQTLLFSATMPPPIAKLAADILDHPVRVEVAPAKVAVDRIEQRVFFVGAKDKRALLDESAQRSPPWTACWSSPAPSAAPTASAAI